MSKKNPRAAPKLLPPEPIAKGHKLDAFDCGEPSLDDWLRRRALHNEAIGGSRTYVICDAEKRVVAYYCLAAGAVSRIASPGLVRRNMPEPIPIVVLGRLAVDRAFQGQRIGSSLLLDAILRTTNAASIAGIRAIMVHAISNEAGRFYEGFGFRASPSNPRTLMITIDEAKRVLKK